MTDAARKGWVFAAGLLAGGALSIGAYVTWVVPELPSSQPGGAAGVAAAPAELLPLVAPQQAQQAEEPQAAVVARQLVPAVPSPLTAPLAVSCRFEPLVPLSGLPDGRYALEAALSVNTGSHPAAYLAVAREAIAEGRVRDAEVALIVACRVAGRALGFYAAELADVKSQLGQHYAQLGSRERGSGLGPELLRRAETLLDDSVRAYSAALGENASETRMATRRLAALTRSTASTALAEHAEALPPDDRESELAMGQAKAGVDCRKARSPAEKIICSDPELAQLDRDLARLHAQARSMTPDQGGFQRRHEQAQVRREASCRDKACLRDWYAQRRSQLFREF